jgi:AraC-like DNA-binding protein
MSTLGDKSLLKWAKPAYTLDVQEVGACTWAGTGSRMTGVSLVWRLALVVGGQGEVRAGAFCGLVGRGDLVWVAPGDALEVKKEGSERVEVLMMSFDLRRAGPDEGFGSKSGSRTLTGANFKRAMKVFEALMGSRLGESTVGDRVLMWANGARLLGLAMEPATWEERPGETQPAGQTLTHVLGLIETRLAGRLELVTLAKLAGLSRTHFAQWFRARMGQSPMRYVRNRRIDRAKALLTSTDLTVEQVARRVGFDDPAHFNRLFKQLTGVPPLRFVRGGNRPKIQ